MKHILGVGDLWNLLLGNKTRIEYIECTGTQWIDTGIDTNPFDISFATKIYYPSGSERAILGNNSNDIFEFYVENNTIGLFNKNNAWLTFDNMAINTIHVIEGTMSTGSLSLTVDGVNKVSVATIVSTNRRLLLFKHNNNFEYIGRLYYMQISIGGELVRDFIPARVGNVGYMYDKVSGQFFANQGSGSFTLGPDV